MYIPQGYTVGLNTLTEHPEWVMAIKYIDDPVLVPTAANSIIKPFTVSSRLARKLQTGDSIQLCVFGNNYGGTDADVTFRFMAQWWTCAN